MPSLTVHDPGGQDTRVVLDPQRPTVMGRDGSCEIVLGHPSISRRHAVVRFGNGAYSVEDLSTNGLFVNGAQVKTCELSDGDELVLGADDDHPIKFSGEDSRLEMTMTQFQYDFTTGALSDLDNLRRLIEVNKAITTSLEMEELFELLLDGILEISSGARAMILLKDKDGELQTAFEQNREREGSSFAGKGISGSVVQRVVDSGEPLLINDVADNPDFEAQASIQALDLRSLVAIPLSYSQAYMKREDANDALMGVIYVDSRSARRRFTQDDLDLLQAFSTQGAISVENAQLHRDLQESYLELVMSLAEAVEIKDRYTRGHSELVSRYSVAIAERLGLNEKEVETVYRGGMLHDVGKIGIDEVILNKPDRLTDEEFAEIKKHPIYGADILAPIAHLSSVRDIVRQHHEKIDGSGYPDGLTGDEMCIGAKIIAVCDVFEGITSNRPYRKPMEPERVVEIFEEERGTKLDAECVDIFLEMYKEAEYKKGAVALADGAAPPEDEEPAGAAEEADDPDDDAGPADDDADDDDPPDDDAGEADSGDEEE